MPTTDRSPLIQRSEIDEERFGIPTARASITAFADLEEIERFRSEHPLKLLIVRCPTSELDLVQRLEDGGARIMDTLVYYSRQIAAGSDFGGSNDVVIRPMQPSDEPSIVQIATQAFRGYRGHYHADPKLDQDLCDAAYVSWAQRSAASRSVAQEVLVAVNEQECLGFATLARNSVEEMEGVLFAISPSAQGRGIYRHLMLRALEWGSRLGSERMIVSTQITNIAVQKVWCRVGFEPTRSYYTLHKWY